MSSSSRPQKQLFGVIGLVLNDKEEILLSHRYDPPVPERHLEWDLPGGTVDFGEAPEEALRREILEETGCTIEITHMLPMTSSRVWKHDDYQLHAIVLPCLCRYISGVFHLNDPKIDDLKWVPLAEIEKYELLPNVRGFIDKLIEEKKKSTLTTRPA